MGPKEKDSKGAELDEEIDKLFDMGEREKEQSSEGEESSEE
jgi:hypothetical protein